MSITDDEGAIVALNLIQHMVAETNHTTDRLIDSLSRDAHRWDVLNNAVLDFADRIDSRELADQLYRLVSRVQSLDGGQAATLARTINYFDQSMPRVHWNSDWTE